MILPLHCGIEIVGLVGPFLGTKEHDLDHIMDDDLQMLAVLFIKGEKESRDHGYDHQKTGSGIAQCALSTEVQRHTDGNANAEADQLPLRQVKQHLGFDLGKVLGNSYIGHFLTSLMGVEYGLGKAAGLEQTEAQQNGVTHTGPDGRTDVCIQSDVLQKHRVDRNTDHNEEGLESQSK